MCFGPANNRLSASHILVLERVAVGIYVNAGFCTVLGHISYGCEEVMGIPCRLTDVYTTSDCACVTLIVALVDVWFCRRENVRWYLLVLEFVCA